MCHYLWVLDSSSHIHIDMSKIVQPETTPMIYDTCAYLSAVYENMLKLRTLSAPWCAVTFNTNMKYTLDIVYLVSTTAFCTYTVR